MRDSAAAPVHPHEALRLGFEGLAVATVLPDDGREIPPVGLVRLGVEKALLQSPAPPSP